MVMGLARNPHMPPVSRRASYDLYTSTVLNLLKVKPKWVNWSLENKSEDDLRCNKKELKQKYSFSARQLTFTVVSATPKFEVAM